MRFVNEYGDCRSSWVPEDEAAETGVSWVLDGETDDEHDVYFCEDELARYHWEERLACIEHEIQSLTVPGWGFLFALDEKSDEAETKRLLEIENRHFKKHEKRLKELEIERKVLLSFLYG